MNSEMKIIIFVVGIVRDLLILGLFVYLVRVCDSIDYARTLLFAILGIKSLMSIFSIRSFKYPIWKLNPFSNIRLVGAVIISTFLLLSAIYWAPLQVALSTVPIVDFKGWILIVSVAIISTAMVEVVKFFYFDKGVKNKI